MHHDAQIQHHSDKDHHAGMLIMPEQEDSM